jgi:hypothetical protein
VADRFDNTGMRRWHLFEWEDQSWLPLVFRDFITDQLKFTHNQRMREPVNRAIAQTLAALMQKAGTNQLVDLCAGAGGPIAHIGRLLETELKAPVSIVVTDLYPNVEAFKALERADTRIRARYEPTDATNVPSELQGVRTIFTALHHFPPNLVTRVLSDAVAKQAPIAVFEPLERTLRMTILVGFFSFVRGFTHALRVGRITPAKIVFTYLLPVAPAMFAWDGAISTLRTYTADELLALAKETAPAGFTWTAGRFDVPGPYGPMPTTYLVGLPAA